MIHKEMDGVPVLSETSAKTASSRFRIIFKFFRHSFCLSEGLVVTRLRAPFFFFFKGVMVV